MLDMYETDDMRKWLSERAVIENTSVFLMHMVVSFPSDEECRLQLMRDGVVLGDIDGLYYNCLSEVCCNCCFTIKCLFKNHTLTAMFQNESVKRVML